MGDASRSRTSAGTDPSWPPRRIGARSVASVGFFTLLSRVTGLLRVATTARFLGTGAAADAFQVAFLIPNLFRRLVGEGAVSSAVVPALTAEAERRGLEHLPPLVEKVLSLWALIAGAITVLGVLFCGWFVSLAFRWGSFSAPEKSALTVELTRLLFPYLFLIGMTAALQGVLHSRRIFALPSAAPVLFNVTFVSCAWLAAPHVAPGREVYVLAAAVLAGGCVQLAVLFPPILRLGIRPRFRWPFDDAGVRTVLARLAPATLGAGVYQVNVLVSTALAARLDEGSVSALGYSNRLMELVLGVFVFALSTVSLTSLAEDAARDDRDAFRRTLHELVGLITFITLPSMAGLYLLREPTLALLLEGGRFDAASRTLTAGAFEFHVLGLAAVGVSRGLVSAFHAVGDVSTPVRIAVLNMIANLALAWGLSETPLAFRGIALAATLAACLQAGALAFALEAKRPGLGLGGGLVQALLRPLPGTAAVVVVVAPLVPFLNAQSSKLGLALWLGAAIAAGAAAYFAVAWALGLPEFRWFLGRFARRRRPPGAGE